MPSKKNKKTGVNFYIDAVLVPEKQREGYQFRNGIATLMPEALARFNLFATRPFAAKGFQTIAPY